MDFPGALLPSEAFLHRGANQVRLCQNPASVTVAVWEGSTKHERALSTLAALADLSPWIEEKLALQARVMEAATRTIAEDAARRDALLPPDVDDVMAALREGQAFQIGGGRSFPTYVMKDGRLVVIHSDEGCTEEAPCSEDDLRAAMARDADVFRQILERRNAR